MYTFIGLLLIAGCFKANQEPILELRSTKGPAPIFRATMSRNRTKSLLRFLRFDDLATRPERRASDKLASIREIQNLFASNCKKAYIPNPAFVTTNNLCPFTVYMKSKPDKYGLKIWALCDSSNTYCWNLQIYAGMTINIPGKEQGKQVVLDLIDGLGSGYGVTMDNFFTSLLLSKELLQQSKTLTGSIRKVEVS
nr:unnamed protein product [Callosobruchus analis]